MNLLIIDNEPILREGIRHMVEALCPQVQRIAESEGVNSGLKAIQELQPDVVILDVEMDDGTGFDLLRQIPEPDFQLIFATAHDRYAVEAFRCSAIDFLLKPIDPMQLKESIDRAAHRMKEANLKAQIDFLLQQVQGKPDPEKRIVLKDIHNVFFVRVREILFCEAERTYTRFYLENHEPILVSRNLKEYESILEPLGFIRTHHSYLVNPDKIQIFDRQDGGTLILDGGHQIPLSQRKKDTVLHLLERRL